MVKLLALPLKIDDLFKEEKNLETHGGKEIIPHIENFFAKEHQPHQKLQLLFLRTDGIVLYQQGMKEVLHLGALISGLWQAAQSLSTALPATQESGYRLSFDTSEQGLYVLPVEIKGSQYFLAGLYHDELNPGKLKQDLKNQGKRLERYLDDKLSNKQYDEGRYLFDNITDTEINHLFQEVGN